MTKLDKLIKQVEEARDKTLAKPPVRLSTKFKHYATTKTNIEEAVQNINRLNRNSPVKRYQTKRKRRK